MVNGNVKACLRIKRFMKICPFGIIKHQDNLRVEIHNQKLKIVFPNSKEDKNKKGVMI